MFCLIAITLLRCPLHKFLIQRHYLPLDDLIARIPLGLHSFPITTPTSGVPVLLFVLSSSSLGTEKKRYHLFFFLRDITNYIIKLHQVTCLFTSNRTFGTFAQWDPAYSGARWTLPGEQVIPKKTSFSFFTRCRRWHLRVCLLAITLACSRLRRSPDVCCCAAKPREHPTRKGEDSEH